MSVSARTLGLLAVFTLAAGYVDGVAFFGYNVFVSAMSGNTVVFAGALVSQLGGRVPGSSGLAVPAISIVAFITGAVTAALIFRAERGHTQARIVLAAIVGLLLGGSAIFHWGSGPGAVEAGIGLLAAAMGMQSIIAARFRIRSVWTTFVTGSLLTAILDFTGGALAGPHREAEGGVSVAAWGLYLAGALSGAFALGRLGPNALWPAAIVVALLVPVI